MTLSYRAGAPKSFPEGGLMNSIKKFSDEPIRTMGDWKRVDIQSYRKAKYHGWLIEMGLALGIKELSPWLEFSTAKEFIDFVKTSPIPCKSGRDFKKFSMAAEFQCRALGFASEVYEYFGWRVASKEASARETKEAIKRFYEIYGRLPRPKIYEEKRLYDSMGTYCHKGPMFDEDFFIWAKNTGWETRQPLSVAKTKILEFYFEKGYLPFQHNTDPYEKKLASVMAKLCSPAKGQGYDKVFDFWARSKGYGDRSRKRSPV